MAYVPKPIETSHISLSSELEALTEKLAENAHDLWAKERLKQGWTHGETRDDDRKTHPCLLPYDVLPESEKTFDRDTAMGTLKAILALGYEIRLPE